MSCNCPKRGFVHWWYYTKLRYYLRCAWHTFRYFGLQWDDGVLMTLDEYEHWFV